MFVLAHIAAGLVIGSALSLLLRDYRWIIPAAIGAVLPDLVDKPVGHLILGGTLNYGRIYCHTLLLFSIALAAGIAWWRWKKSPAFLALAVGILSHQLLDAMWLEPWNWFCPFQGPFRDPGGGTSDLFSGILGELTSPGEYIAGISMIPVVLFLLRKDWFVRVFSRHGRTVKPVFAVLIVAIAAAGIFTVAAALSGQAAVLTHSADRT